MPVEQPLPSGAAPDSGLLPVVSQLATGSTWSGPARPGRPRRQMGPVTGHGAVTGTCGQNGGTGPKNGLNHDPCGNLEDGAERWVGKHPIECEPSIPGSDTMGLVPAFCGETRNRARPKTELLLSQKRIPAADFVSMQC